MAVKLGNRVQDKKDVWRRVRRSTHGKNLLRFTLVFIQGSNMVMRFLLVRWTWKSTSVYRIDRNVNPYKLVVFWPRDSKCRMAFDSHFQIQGRRHIKVVTISSGIGWLANVFQWLMSKLFKRYFPRDYRQVPDYGIFLSTMHSCWDGFRRYKFVAFKSYSHDV